MQSLSHLNHLLMNMCRDLQALHREHVVIISLSHKVNAWRRELTTALMRPVRLARFLPRSSFIEATLHRKERMATDLLAFHSFTLSYTSTHSLIHVLWGVYQRHPCLFLLAVSPLWCMWVGALRAAAFQLQHPELCPLYFQVFFSFTPGHLLPVFCEGGPVDPPLVQMISCVRTTAL